MALHRTKIDIPEDKRQELIAILNQSLADAADLKSQAKQAHWNVKGPNFIALHELFDRVATELDTHVDDLAERVTTLGGTAMGTVRLAASNSSLSEYPHEITDGTAHVDALSGAMADFGRKVRADIDRTDELGDKDTADLYTGISREVDKLLWFVEAHNQA
jgi:starvation-inducible DNA-binding protein